jgi:hypothetical protein
VVTLFSCGIFYHVRYCTGLVVSLSCSHSTVEGSITFQQVLEYEIEHNLQDYTEPEEEIHALLSEEDIIYYNDIICSI